MRLVLVDRPTEKRIHFYPVALSRPIWELRCGMTSLREKLLAKIAANDTAYFVPPYMAEVYRGQADGPVNDTASLAGIKVDGRRVRSAALGKSNLIELSRDRVIRWRWLSAPE